MEIKNNIARVDILNLLYVVKNYGWGAVKSDTIHRVMYLSGTSFLFVNKKDKNPFEGYNFTRMGYGPFSYEIKKALDYLIKDEFLVHDSNTQYLLLNKSVELDKIASPDSDTKRLWVETIVQTLAIYGEDKVYEFIFKDPQFKDTIASNAEVSFNLGPNNPTISYLEEFRLEFEKQLKIEKGTLNEKDYLRLYFEYIFSEIIKRNQ